MEYLSVIFFILAAICNAMMDTLQFHWYKFRWNNIVNKQYFDPSVSWRNKYVDGDPKKGLRFKGIFGWINNLLDAWHLFKSSAIVLITFSIVCFPFANPICFCKSVLCNQLIWVLIFGIAWNGAFNLFFNRIFVIKQK